ncbi:MAG TPA: hypothetical protein VM487_18785 [Phycisphaerae bacterium]|nr:hypothetical protein [Phycisphaerae bacterium]
MSSSHVKPPRRTSRSALPRIASPLLLSVALVAPRTAAQQPKVTITGGADASGQNYRWTVTNHYGSPVVYIQFPHYHADTFFAPDGWEKECTNLIGVGARNAPGTCTAWADSPEKGIAPGRSAEFSVRLAAVGAHRRPGQVTVRFADGTQTIVAGVELPTASTTSEQLYALIGFAMVFAIVVYVQVRRRRRTPRAPEPDSASATDDE